MEKATRQTSTAAEPIHLHRHAEDNLRFIRESMERATSFTGVSGKGYCLGGLSAVAAGWLASQQGTAALWMSVWMLELVLAACVMLAFTMRKSQSQGSNLFGSASGRKLLYAFLPSMFVGGILTVTFMQAELYHLMPAMWLGLYGAAIMTAGAHSVKAVPVMGLMFILAGIAAAFTSLNKDLILGLGFGGLHLGFGAWIWSRHGG